MSLTMMKAKISQQESAVEMMQMLISNGRARPEKLEAAINELNRLKSESVKLPGSGPVKPDAQRIARPSRLVQNIMKDVDADPVALKRSGLIEEASRLRKEQAELSNMLHKIPAG